MERRFCRNYVPQEYSDGIPPQDVCEHTKMTDKSSQYNHNELASAQSQHTLKNTKVGTENTRKDPSDDKTLKLIGTKYIHKRSRSKGDIQQNMSSDVQDMVSKNAYGKHRTTKSLDQQNKTFIIT